jgi:hypothetical protein
MTRNISYVLPKTVTTYYFCLILSVDTTTALYTAVGHLTCPATQNITSLNTLQALVEVQYSDYLQLDNAILHDWLNTSAGDLGLAYDCSSTSCILTAFQTILANSTDPLYNQSFGLDFRDSNSTIASINSTGSSMQLGGWKEDYSSTINWFQQSQLNPTFHELFIENLQFCGASILGNYSSNWEVLIDTGAACLTLPGEIYDSFYVWFNNATVVATFADLPAFSFNVIGQQEILYIPLAALIVTDDAIATETGAPYVHSLEQGSSRTCVLRGTDVENSVGDYTSPTPLISFGSMVLRALYFAANYQNVSLGLANKLLPHEVAYYANATNPSCARAVTCVGQQGYEPASNSCKRPPCVRYFFTSLDSTGSTCTYDHSATIFGVIFICLLAAMEVMSYFLNQYSASTLLLARLPGTSIVTVDRFTACLGRYMSYVADQIIVKLLKWNDGGGHTMVRNDQQDELLLHRV